MTNRTAINSLALLFTGCCLLFSRVHGPRVFFIGEGDDEAYYAYTRSMLVDHDLDFSNEPLPTFKDNARANFSAGRYAIGPGILWMPFFEFADVMTRLFVSHRSAEQVAGISPLYWLFVCSGSILYGYAGYLFLFLFLRRYFSVEASFWCVCLVGFSSPLLYYLFDRPLMSHSSEFFCLCTAAYLVSGLHSESARSAVNGSAAACGMLFLCRWMDAFYVAALAGWGLWRLRSSSLRLAHINSRQSFFVMIIGFIASLQLLVWHHLTGQFYPGIAMFGLAQMKSSVIFSVYPWTMKHLIDFWIGVDWGILWISPILWLTLPALFLWELPIDQKLAKSVIVVPSILSFWISANWPSHGGEYANRYLIPCWLIFSFLFAESWTWVSTYHPSWLRKMVLAGLLALGYSLFMLTLFKSNADTLTLHVGPTLYQLPSDWVNHRYVLEASKILIVSPIFAIGTFGASLIGLFIFKGLSVLSLAHLHVLDLYYLKHPPPSGRDLFCMMALILLGIFLLTRAAREL